MKMMKTTTAMSLSVVLLAFGLSACGGSDTRTDTKPKEVPKKVVPPEAVLKTGLKKEALDTFNGAITELGKGSGANKEKAVGDLEKVVELEPEFAEAHYNLGLMRMESGQYGQAREHLEKAREIEPARAEYRVALARTYAMTDQFDKAQEIYTAVLATSPGNLTAKNNLAILAYKRNEYDQSMKYIKEILRDDERNVGALTTLGLIYTEQKNFGLAEYIFKKALCIEEDKASGKKKVKKRGAMRTVPTAKKDDGKKKPEAKAEKKEEAPACDPQKPSNPDLWNNLGQVYLAQSNLPKAVKAFKRANESDKRFIESRLNLGAILIEYLDYERADEMFKEAVAISGTHCEARLGKAAMDFARNRPQDAEKGFLWFIDNCDKKHGSSHLRLAKLYETKLQDFKKTYEYYYKLRDLTEDEKKRKEYEALGNTYKSMYNKQKDKPKKPAPAAAPKPEGEKPAAADPEAAPAAPPAKGGDATPTPGSGEEG